MTLSRTDGRGHDTARPVAVQLGFQRFPEGSVLYSCGDTRVMIAASVEEGVRDWLRGTGKGWVTAEYAMHPRCNPTRNQRDGRKGRIDGRSQEIQRLIARALRGAVVLEKLGERSITVDCDVLDADGGTRTASITGGMIALCMALDVVRKRGLIEGGVLREPIAAVSVGLVDGKPMLDLKYDEDSRAEVDLNVVGTASGRLIEVQGTAEGAPIERRHLDTLLDMALGAMPGLVEEQTAALTSAGIDWKKLLA